MPAIQSYCILKLNGCDFVFHIGSTPAGNIIALKVISGFLTPVISILSPVLRSRCLEGEFSSVIVQHDIIVLAITIRYGPDVCLCGLADTFVSFGRKLLLGLFRSFCDTLRLLSVRSYVSCLLGTALDCLS